MLLPGMGKLQFPHPYLGERVRHYTLFIKPVLRFPRQAFGGLVAGHYTAGGRLRRIVHARESERASAASAHQSRGTKSMASGTDLGERERTRPGGLDPARRESPLWGGDTPGSVATS